MPTNAPAVLFIIADDWSPLARCYGNEVIHTPHIDAAADRGTTFHHAFCTTPSCAASRASILTGQHSHTHGQYGHCHSIHGFRTHEWMPSLPKVLGEAGTHCELVGKHHTAPDHVYPWARRGTPETPTPTGFRQRVAEALSHDRPSFVMVAPSWPHREGDESGFGLTRWRDTFNDADHDPGEVTVPRFLPDLPGVREDLAAYYGAIARYDQCVGGAIEAVRDAGREGGTLIVICSDHGMPFVGAKASCYDTGHRCPLIVVRPGVRPGQRGGVHSQALVNWLDHAPTIYDWLGVEPPVVERWPGRWGQPDEPVTLPGRSLVPILEEPEPAGWERTTFSHCFHEITNYDPYRVLRERRYKFVQRLAHQLPMPVPADLLVSRSWKAVLESGDGQLGERRIEQYRDRPLEALYDVESDPMEAVNLAELPEHAERVARMRRELLAFRDRTRDPFLMLDVQRDPGCVDVARVVT